LVTEGDPGSEGKFADFHASLTKSAVVHKQAHGCTFCLPGTRKLRRALSHDKFLSAGLDLF
jgi:hypothetical protein